MDWKCNWMNASVRYAYTRCSSFTYSFRQPIITMDSNYKHLPCLLPNVVFDVFLVPVFCQMIFCKCFYITSCIYLHYYNGRNKFTADYL